MERSKVPLRCQTFGGWVDGDVFLLTNVTPITSTTRERERESECRRHPLGVAHQPRREGSESKRGQRPPEVRQPGRLGPELQRVWRTGQQGGRGTQAAQEEAPTPENAPTRGWVWGLETDL